METSKPESPSYAAFETSDSGDADASVQAGGKKCQRKCKGAKWFKRANKCSRFPWMSLSVFIFTIWLCFKSRHAAKKLSHAVKDFVETVMTFPDEDSHEHGFHFCLKGYLTRTFCAVIICNLGISIMSFKANGFCKCPKKCKKEMDCKKRCRKNCCKWFMHTLFLWVAYILAATVFVSVLGAVVLTTVTAASDGVCKSGFNNLTEIANTVLVAFKNWMCQLAAEESEDSSSSSSSEDWHHGHHGHHMSADRLCEELPTAFTDEQVDAWCEAADVMWHPMAVLVWIGACLAIAQFTMALLQRANTVAHNKSVEGERKEFWAAWKKSHCDAAGAKVTVFSETTTPGGDETTAQPAIKV